VLPGFGRRNYYSTQYITAVVSINIQVVNITQNVREFCIQTVVVGCHYRLVGDVLLWSAFVSYAGPFSLNDRDKLLDNWLGFVKLQNIPYTENTDITDALVDADTVCVPAAKQS